MQWVNMYPESDDTEYIDGSNYQICDKNPYKMKITFVEDAFKYLIFHVVIESYVNDTLLIEAEDLRWAVDYEDQRRIWIKPIDKNEMIDLLEDQKEEVKKAKKSSTIANAIVAGIETLAIAASPGGGVAALVYAAESSAYIAEDRNSFKVASLSIEDEITYIEDWVLSEEELPSYESIDFDIIIERDLYEKPVIIRALIEDETCEFVFTPDIIEERI